MGGKMGGALPGMGKKSGLPGFGKGKGGRGAGFAGGVNPAEKNKLKLSLAPPNAKVSGQRGSEKNPGLTLMFKGEPERGAKASIPYYEAYGRQKKVAESAVNKENIPAPYRKQVKDYFESIRPEN